MERMFRLPKRVFSLACGIGVLATAALAVGPVSASAKASNVKHVLLISVDGLHQTDLMWYIEHNPNSTLAGLVRGGVEFTNAHTPFPSDSFPGMTAPMTGGNPRSTGIYYDDTWNRALFPAAATNNQALHDCRGLTPGVEVTYFEQLDKDLTSLDAGQGLAGLPGSILQMTSNPLNVIDPTQLPRDANCNPVYPSQYVRVNTIMNVAHDAGLLTAWSDKHPAYELFNGPECNVATNVGCGVEDYFTPEINSDALGYPAGLDWTQDNAATMQYDNYKVEAVLNWIDGKHHDGSPWDTPAIFGMNFQTVSTAEKLPVADLVTGGLPGGYQVVNGQVVPGPLLKNALGFINDEVGKMTSAINARGLASSTVIILTAKHAQSPEDPRALTRIKDSTIMDQLNSAWAKTHPDNPSLVVFSVNDDGMLIWLSDRSPAAESFAKNFLLNYNGNGSGSDGMAKATDINGNPKAYTAAGNAKIYAAQEAADFIGVPFNDGRVPDLIGIAQYGTVYTGGTKKIAEHGGDNPQDRDVPILIAGGSIHGGRMMNEWVETTQIAPTILRLLGLNPRNLLAVQIEHTRALPLGRGED
jgi:Type I phosphodiesterase / nucleotide pyrophosphatase